MREHGPRGSVAITTRRTRLQIARLLFRIAVWIGGGGESIFGCHRESQRHAANEDDTEEIDTDLRQ